MRKTALLTLFLLAASPAFAVQEVTALQIQGEVRFQEAGSAEWKALVPGARLAEGTRITTGKDGACLLGFKGDKEGTLKLKDSSSLLLKGLSEPTKLALDNGALFARVHKMSKTSHFEVKTPTAVATVRGTGWLESAEQVDVFDGTVHVEGADGESMDVGEGESLPIDPSGDLGDLGPISDEAKTEYESFSSESAQAGTPAPETEEAGGGAEEEQEESMLEEAPAGPEDAGEGFREEVMDAQEDQQEIQEEEEQEQDDEGEDDNGGGQHITQGG